MALQGKMRIEGVEELYTVVECEYSLGQKVNASNGLPQYGLSASQLEVTIVTPPKGRPLYEWMMDEWHYLNGIIRLVTNVNSHHPSVRHVWFENGKCVGLYEYFNKNNSVMMTTRLTIQPAKMGFVDGNKLDETNIGYDFRNRRMTSEKPEKDIENQIVNKFAMDWEADRNWDEIQQIAYDPSDIYK
jgi:hypothetical protein